MLRPEYSFAAAQGGPSSGPATFTSALAWVGPVVATGGTVLVARFRRRLRPARSAREVASRVAGETVRPTEGGDRRRRP